VKIKYNEKLLYQVGDLFELNVKPRCQKVKRLAPNPESVEIQKMN
jgi:hypothetical protein